MKFALWANSGKILDETAGFEVIIPTLLRHFFDASVVACRVQDVVIPKVDCDVANTLNARQMLTAFVGEIDAIPSLQVVPCDELSLLELRTSGDVE